MKTVTVLEREIERYETRTPGSRALWEKARRVMPMGTASNSRMYEPYPLFIARAEGARVWDVDGNEYIDHNLSFGALVVGHRHPVVIGAVNAQLSAGTMYGMSHAVESDLAEEICRRYPFLDRVRFSNSGTEATLHALRLAKAYTGRPQIIKMEGGYHGLHDSVMVSVKPNEEQWGSAVHPSAVPASAGVPESNNTLVAQFNDLESLEQLLREAGEQVAAVILEPVMMNVGVLPPKHGYLEGVRELCTRYGVLLIFDEVKTSSMSYGGAAEYYRITPDIVCLSKSIGGGFPLAAFASTARITEVIESRKMMHAGTYNANPVVVAAGLAALRDVLTPDTYPAMRSLSDRLADGYRDIFSAAGVPAVVTNAGVNGAVTFGVVESVSNYREWTRMNTDMWQCFWFGMVNRGVIAQPYWWDEQWTISVAHTPHDIDMHLDALKEVTAKGLCNL